LPGCTTSAASSPDGNTTSRTSSASSTLPAFTCCSDIYETTSSPHGEKRLLKQRDISAFVIIVAAILPVIQLCQLLAQIRKQSTSPGMNAFVLTAGEAEAESDRATDAKLLIRYTAPLMGPGHAASGPGGSEGLSLTGIVWLHAPGAFLRYPQREKRRIPARRKLARESRGEVRLAESTSSCRASESHADYALRLSCCAVGGRWQSAADRSPIDGPSRLSSPVIQDLRTLHGAQEHWWNNCSFSSVT
jgi:hypothetical protein